MRIFTAASGLGGSRDDALFDRVRALAAEVHASDPSLAQVKVGYGGDIPNTKAEKDALLHEALWATVIAAVLILAGVIWFYGSPWALILVGFPPLFGVGCAYAFATLKYGLSTSPAMERFVMRRRMPAGDR